MLHCSAVDWVRECVAGYALPDGGVTVTPKYVGAVLM